MTTPTHKLENFPASSEFLASTLKTNPVVGRVWLFDEIPSTQTFLEGVENLTVGDIAVARHQTSGRGRLSRTWDDEAEHSILLSIALPKSDVLTLAVGLGVLGALTEWCPELSLKWPNDIVVVESEHYFKIGGIITTGVDKDLAIAGIGVNLISPVGVPQALGLSDLTAEKLDVTKILQSIVDEVLRTLTLDAQDIIREYRIRTSTIDRYVRILAMNGKSIYGKAIDVANDGALLLETENGQIRILSGDVQYVRFAEH